jgi:GR25 family glycosyltransferase involved in LPS biosynthesis
MRRSLEEEAEKNRFNLPDYCEVYTVAYNSPERAAQMTERFAKVGLPLNAHAGVQMDDPRLEFAGDDLSAKRLASVFYGHLDNIAKFYETGKPFGLFCEDDVHIHKDLGKELPIIMGEFNAMKLDILLLGYMTTKTIEWWQQNYPLVYDGVHAPYRYHRYPNDQWGIHLFMISRSYAKTLLEVYGPDYAANAYKDPNMTCCNPDWTLSKHTANRALRYPMLAVEDGKGNYDHHGQGEFHRESHRQNYREGEFY